MNRTKQVDKLIINEEKKKEGRNRKCSESHQESKKN